MNKKGITALLGTILYGAFIVGITVLFYSNFSLYKSYFFKSDVYLIENDYVFNISSLTSPDLYKKYFDYQNYKLKLENNGEYIANGSKLLVIDKSDRLISTLTNIVKGDIISDGIIDEKDLYRFEEIVKNNYNLTEVETLCLDINNDKKVTSNDLTLLKNAISNGISSMGIREKNINILTDESYRLVVEVTPNYGINTNLLWKSNNESIATVDESGKVTAHANGDAVITVKNLAETIVKEFNIKVDSNIKLSSNQGVSFVTDPELSINIRAIDYKNLSCQSSNPEISNCRIDKKVLYIKSLKRGESIITVTSPNNGNVTYNLTSYESYLDFIPEYYCMSINRSDILNLRYIYNDLTISNNNFTHNTYFKNNQFYIRSKSNPGRDELTITDNASNNKKLTVDVYRLNIPSIGAFIKVGEEKSAIIVSENTNTLKCTSPNENIATCYIKDNKLYVKGITKGEVNLKITNTTIFNNEEYDCGETGFLAVIKN